MCGLAADLSLQLRQAGDANGAGKRVVGVSRHFSCRILHLFASILSGAVQAGVNKLPNMADIAGGAGYLGAKLQNAGISSALAAQGFDITPHLASLFVAAGGEFLAEADVDCESAPHTSCP